MGFDGSPQGLITCPQPGQAHLYCIPWRLTLCGAEATSCLSPGGGGRGFDPSLAEEDPEKQGFWWLPGLEPRYELWLPVPRLNRLAPCSELFRVSALRGRLGGQMGLNVACPSPMHTGWFWGPPSGWRSSGQPLALDHCWPSRPWRQGRTSEPRAPGRLPSAWL